MQPNSFVKLFWYLEIVPKLGILNVFYVFIYRLKLKYGLFLKRYPIIKIANEGDVYIDRRPDVKGYNSTWEKELIVRANRIIDGCLPYYSHHWIKQSTPPDWFVNRFNGKKCNQEKIHWTKIADFNNDLGDIKNIWELSRFSWVGILARAYAISGNTKYLKTLNEWLSDWVSKNPLNQGPNWKCGQEASFRLINLLNSANILSQLDSPTEMLILIVQLHLRRISSNLKYGLAQRNNHATSEAAALYIGGNWLLKVSDSNHRLYQKYAEKGKTALEKLVRQLTYEDGRFAQHSLIYHRLFLDTVSNTLIWSEQLHLSRFSPEYYNTVEKSLDWLLSIVDKSGFCSNLGSNDGTMLLSDHSCDYKDYRPSLQISSVLLKGKRVFGNGLHDEELFWMRVEADSYPIVLSIKKSQFYKSGYTIMNGEDSRALIRLPNYQFRPSHNDVMHFDLWADGKNILFDSGSYSYNPDKESIVPDLKSVHSHNSLSFDGGEQMPRLGRFLLAKWIKPIFNQMHVLNHTSGEWEGAYKDYLGNYHERRILWKNNTWEINDKFSGNASTVEIGFNFEKCEYLIKENEIELPWGKIIVPINAGIQVADQLISNYYFQYETVFRLMITSPNNRKLKTTIQIIK